jgi:hypothetical protein
VRVLLAYSPLDFESVPEIGDVPIAYALKDIVIVREKLNTRPLNSDVAPDVLWSEASESIRTTRVSGVSSRCRPDGSVQDTTVDRVVQSVTDHQSEDQQENYSRVFPGGIFVDAALILAVGLEASARVSWIPQGSISSGANVSAGEVRFMLQDGVRKTTQGLSPNPPIVVDFSADTLVVR